MADEMLKNVRAERFESYLKKNDINFFQKNELQDEADTISFVSNIPVEGQTLPVVVITDNTIYTIIRVQVAVGLLREENKAKIEAYLNELNRSYKVFKYVATEEGAIFLDACLPSSNEAFEPELVRVILDVMADHLKDEYKKLMQKAWSK